MRHCTDLVLDAEGSRVVLEMLRSPPPPTEALRVLMSRPRRFGELRPRNASRRESPVLGTSATA